MGAVYAVLFSVLIAGAVHAAETTTPVAAEVSVDPAKSEIHRNKARLLIEEKNWQQALVEIRQATQLNPKAADAWLIQGTVAMRLEENAEALDAFNKYLALNPPVDKATAVRQRIAEVELRLDKQKAEANAKAEAAAEERAKRVGPGGSGIYFAISPTYKPGITSSDDLGSSMDKSFDFGFRFGFVDWGFKFGSGDIPGIIVRKEKDNSLVGTYTKGKHNLYEMYFRFGIPLSEPQAGQAGHSFLIPIHMGMFMNNAKFNKTYGNIGFDFGSGLQYRYYTGSSFVFDVSALYYLGLPFWKIQNADSEILAVYNLNGDRAKGSMSGSELRAGITLLF
jgi:tetratricopeptide (TPR) repeat protein